MLNDKRITISSLLALGLLLLLLVPTAGAFEGRGDEATFTLAAGEVINDDLYVSADTVQIDGTVNGDLFAAASLLVINGVVNGDVFGGGNEVVINGRVADDVRIAGAALRILGAVEGDVLAAGYGIVLGPESTIASDALVAGYSVIAGGTVGRDLWLGAENARLDGRVGRNATLSVGDGDGEFTMDPVLFNPQMPAIERASNGLTIAPSAAIAGDLRYETRAQVNVPTGVVGGQTTFDAVTVDAQAPVSQGQRFAREVWGAAQRWLLTLLTGWLLLRFAGAWLGRTVAAIDASLAGAAGYGLLWYFGWMVLMLVGLFAVITLAILFGVLQLPAISGAIVGGGLFGLGTALGFYILLLLFVTKAIVGYWLGGRLLPAGSNKVAQLALGALIVHLLTVVPFVGPLFNLLTAALGLGAIWLAWRGHAQPVEKQPQAVAIA